MVAAASFTGHREKGAQPGLLEMIGALGMSRMCFWTMYSLILHSSVTLALAYSTILTTTSTGMEMSEAVGMLSVAARIDST